MIPLSAMSAERLGQVIGWLGDDLMRIAPQDLALSRRRDRPYWQAALFDQPGTITRTTDRFPGVRMEPADAPDRIPALEMPAEPVSTRLFGWISGVTNRKYMMTPTAPAGAVFLLLRFGTWKAALRRRQAMAEGRHLVKCMDMPFIVAS